MNCSYCGNPASVINEDDRLLLCNQCASLAGTCYLCIQGRYCEFETNPDPMPKQVAKVIQQGNMRVQTVVKNPSRVDAFCTNKCPCFNPEFGCLKENGTCGNYNERKP